MAILELTTGANLHYGDTGGSGTPIVLVHGSPGDGRSWGRVCQEVPDRHARADP